MTPREIIVKAAALGVVLTARNGKLRYRGEAQAVNAVLGLLRDHKDDIVAELEAEIPRHVRCFLVLGGYEDLLTEWTPGACQAFLERLEAEWDEFRVCGWRGCEFPSDWPWVAMDAVTTIYVHAMQEPEQ